VILKEAFHSDLFVTLFADCTACSAEGPFFIPLYSLCISQGYCTVSLFKVREYCKDIDVYITSP
jgi:hypothetical protein